MFPLKSVIIQYNEESGSPVAPVTFQGLSGRMWLRMAMVTKSSGGRQGSCLQCPKGRERHTVGASYMSVGKEREKERERSRIAFGLNAGHKQRARCGGAGSVSGTGRTWRWGQNNTGRAGVGTQGRRGPRGTMSRPGFEGAQLETQDSRP